MIVALVAVMMIFGIPLSAIVGSYLLKMKKLELEQGGALSADAARKLAQLEADNRDLRARVEVLETIVTSDDAPRSRSRVRVDADQPASEAQYESAASAADARINRR